MELKGKKVIFLGDSITEGAAASRAENVFHQHIKRDLDLFEAVNCGIGGTRIARQKTASALPAYDIDFNRRAEGLDRDADLVVVFGGTNDFGHGDAPLGKWGDDTVYTFYGAYRRLLSVLCKNYAKEKVVAVTPLHRVGEENPFGDGSKKTASAPLGDYVAAILKTTECMGIKTLDLWKDTQLDPNLSGKEKYFADGLHPNDEGHALLGKKIADFLAGL